jgi:hypothetical protein
MSARSFAAALLLRVAGMPGSGSRGAAVVAETHRFYEAP